MIITISRQLGSGGEDIGQLLAKRLRIAYLDRELLLRAAGAGVLSQERVKGDDERPPSLLNRITAFSLSISGLSTRLVKDGERVEPLLEGDYEYHNHLVEEAIRQVAQEDGAVIIGRGGQVILRDDPRALHVYVHAPEETRIRRLLEREGMPAPEARREVWESDRNRAGFLKAVYGVEWGDPVLYDLVINTARLDEETAADLIARAAQTLAHQA